MQSKVAGRAWGPARGGQIIGPGTSGPETAIQPFQRTSIHHKVSSATLTLGPPPEHTVSSPSNSNEQLPKSNRKYKCPTS